MRITYDPEVDALYIQFAEVEVMTEHVSEGIAIDYDRDGKIAGIEILDAKKRLAGALPFGEVVLENLLHTTTGIR